MDNELKKIIEATRVFVLDMDGTVYIGDQLIGRMCETLSKIRRSGRKIVYCTNNSSKTAREYEEKLKRLGIWEREDLVYTSGMATVQYLQERYAGKRVYLVGTDALKEEFRSEGIALCEEGADVCVLAYDTSLTFEKLVKINEYIVRKKPYIATHPDDVCPAPGVFAPDVGSFIALLKRSSGREPDVICGKPYTVMGKALCKRVREDASAITMVGDRPHTDIRFGNNNRFNTLLVLSGETDLEKAKRLTGQDVPKAICGSLNDVVSYL